MENIEEDVANSRREKCEEGSRESEKEEKNRVLESSGKTKAVGIDMDIENGQVPVGVNIKKAQDMGKLTGPWRLPSSRSKLPLEFLDSGFCTKKKRQREREDREKGERERAERFKKGNPLSSRFLPISSQYAVHKVPGSRVSFMTFHVFHYTMQKPQHFQKRSTFMTIITSMSCYNCIANTIK